MADRLHMSVSQYSKVEVGVRNLNRLALKKLCDQFAVSSDWVLYGQGGGPAMGESAGGVREQRALFCVGKDAVAEDWVDQLMECIEEKADVIETGVSEHGLTMDVAIRPAIRAFVRRMEER